MHGALSVSKKCLLQLCVLLALFIYFSCSSHYCKICIRVSSNQGGNDTFSSCDFEHRIVFACNQLHDVQWYVCGLQQHATCVLKNCVGKSSHMTEKPKTSASFCAKQSNFNLRLCTACEYCLCNAFLR